MSDQTPQQEDHGNPTKVTDPGSELVDADPNFESLMDKADESSDVPPPIARATGNTAAKGSGTRPPEIDVHYAFAGSGIAGENLNVCSVCSALVKDSGTESHTAWHRSGGV